MTIAAPNIAASIATILEKGTNKDGSGGTPDCSLDSTCGTATNGADKASDERGQLDQEFLFRHMRNQRKRQWHVHMEGDYQGSRRPLRTREVQDRCEHQRHPESCTNKREQPRS